MGGVGKRKPIDKLLSPRPVPNNEKRAAAVKPVELEFGSMMAKFAAFALDINGTALARYDLAATEKESAEREARQYLERHQVIEVWSDDHRRVARIVRAPDGKDFGRV